MTKINTAAVLSFFSGKSKENAEAALSLLADSVNAGAWIPGASRKVAAALNKCNEAIKIVRKADDNEIPGFDRSESRTDESNAAAHLLWEATHCLRFGSFVRAVAVFDKLGPPCREEPGARRDPSAVRALRRRVSPRRRDDASP